MFKPTVRKPRDTEKTIQELKMSIDSIERMIEKSQKILKNTRHMQPREVRSDSIEFRFNTNSKSKSKSKSKILIESRLGKLNTTTATSNDATINSFAHNSLQKIKNKPQKTKPQLFIDIDKVQDRVHDIKDKILIHDAHSPVSAIDYQEENFIDSSSFADSVESNFNLAKRFKTENLNDSWENKFFSSSIQKKNEKIVSPKGGRRIVLRKKRQEEIKNLTDLGGCKDKSKRRIFDSKVQPSRFSNYHQNISKKQIKKALMEPKRDEFRVSTLASARTPCSRFQKQNNQMDMELFLKKVKQYGFVERYLSRSEICCIYEYLKNSSVPEYKWPLYVVDEVYEKMQTPKNNRQQMV